MIFLSSRLPVNFISQVADGVGFWQTISAIKTGGGAQERLTTEQLRQRLREAGIPKFILPATAMRALTVFIGCIDYNESIWQDSDEYVRELIGMFCDASLAAVFLGLIEELTERPASAEEWGETGTSLLSVLPRTRAILGAAMAALSPGDRRFLDHYGTCGWDEVSTAKRLGLSR
jgi:hypothetical protein